MERRKPLLRKASELMTYDVEHLRAHARTDDNRETIVRGQSRRALAAKCAVLIVSTALAVEMACQCYLWHLNRSWAEIKRRPDHYFTASENPALGYELARNRFLEKGGRTLHINAHGIRDDGQGLYEDKFRIALLGDSVTFGTNQSQEKTIGALLQHELDPDEEAIKVLNFGVPGYGLDELYEQLRVKDAIYSVDLVVFILNANDFTRRDSRYEGADNGLYRMYVRPRLASLWVARKIPYRLKKGGSLVNPHPVSVEWYRWLFTANKEHGLSLIEEMHAYCQEKGVPFVLVLLPAGCAYRNGRYELDDMYDELQRRACKSGIVTLDGREVFQGGGQAFFDPTDHLHQEGNRALAEFLTEQCARILTDSRRKSCHR